MKTVWVLEDGQEIDREAYVYGGTFRPGQSVIINSEAYKVVSDEPRRDGRTVTIRAMGRCEATPCGELVPIAKVRKHLKECEFCPHDQLRSKRTRLRADAALIEEGVKEDGRW